MKKFLIIVLCFIALNSNAQNLVINPSFENTIPCWIFINLGTWQMQCTNWYSASGGSPDYFSETYDPLCYALPVPQSTAGYQYARTGVAYVGLATIGSTLFPSHANIREYVGGILSDTLKQGHEYCVSFYVSVAEELKYVTDGIGLYLSVDSAVDYTINTNLSFVPQISNPAGNIIYDTLNWVQISGTYIANGGEKYLTIGNFKDDANTMIDSTSATSLNAYLFIDDVSVIDCTVGINEIESYKNKISLMPNPAIEKTIYSNQLEKNQKGVINIYSKFGVRVSSYLLHEGYNKVLIDLHELAQGVYIIKTEVNGRVTDIRKLVVIK
ncbi:MAG TPA: T9SS type A sorting domain-containing protein [Bacteroidia bacterium]|nr:T9SS type A sorting domain-containing protein [Bacteroidia bacterium]HMU20064.1 T9SS type A sorting domain-containing protein [Bacteroidia bacterium]